MIWATSSKPNTTACAPLNRSSNRPPFWKFWSHSCRVEPQRVRLTQAQIETLTWQARYNVVARIFTRVGQQLGQTSDAGS